jgi:hypothetical protein
MLGLPGCVPAGSPLDCRAQQATTASGLAAARAEAVTLFASVRTSAHRSTRHPGDAAKHASVVRGLLVNIAHSSGVKRICLKKRGTAMASRQFARFMLYDLVKLPEAPTSILAA